MLGRVYTFERDMADILPSHEPASTAAVNAVLAAINGRPGIRFELLTDADNPKPVIAVLFGNPVSMAYFDSLIEATLKVAGIRVRVTHGTAAVSSENEQATRVA